MNFKTKEEKKRLEEELYLSNFLKKFGIFENTEITKLTTPDFWIRHNNKKISIEVTRIFNNKKQNGVIQVEQNGLCEDVVRIAEDLYKNKYSDNFVASLSFSPYLKLEKKLTTNLAERIVELIRNNMPSQGICEVADDLLIDELSFLHIFVDKNIDSASIKLNYGFWLGIAPKELIDEAITEKLKLIRNYTESFDEKWLLIVIPGTLPSSNFKLPTQYYTEQNNFFERTFIYDYITNSFIEIQNR